MKKLALFLPLIAALTWVYFGNSVESKVQHERLRFQNNFKNPEDVVRYYCARDASGFIWSGLLEVERRAFTLWQQIPQSESFLIAKNYKIHSQQIHGQKAQVEVSYQLTGIGNALGVRMPPLSQSHRVRFVLQKEQGRWKISEPKPDEISPVVMEEKFPF